MTLEIISRKVTHKIGTGIAYQFRFYGEDGHEFREWLSSRPITQQWNSYPWFGWEFINSEDDVAIRLLWAEYLTTIDGEHFPS